MSRDPIGRIPPGSYALPGPRPGVDPELWTAWRDDAGRPRLTRRTAGLGLRPDRRSVVWAAIAILRDISAARGRYVTATGRCCWCTTTVLGSRHESHLGGCLPCAETRHPAELAAVAAAARRALEYASVA